MSLFHVEYKKSAEGKQSGTATLAGTYMNRFSFLKDSILVLGGMFRPSAAQDGHMRLINRYFVFLWWVECQYRCVGSR